MWQSFCFMRKYVIDNIQLILVLDRMYIFDGYNSKC